jgi:hypothetical protein
MRIHKPVLLARAGGEMGGAGWNMLITEAPYL